jgi:hypothetical protein
MIWTEKNGGEVVIRIGQNTFCVDGGGLSNLTDADKRIHSMSKPGEQLGRAMVSARQRWPRWLLGQSFSWHEVLNVEDLHGRSEQ